MLPRSIANNLLTTGYYILSVKVAVTDMRYFVRSKLSRRLVHKKNFSLVWQLVFKLGYILCQ